ncbi:glutamate-5-semialdehyde dehydrogenase [Rhabdaerophilum sp. SD176]|uniref:glutamate-5-semialdehyde dehydrogenase n=1 Tax=Rhabdaerophilum sp. SD176 TaxID=2983548 RepID=UPI0024E03872|nr:glutamate-5-semialdehyde dehydrogenase [Rhabdaerophilum sp. SD176]
MNRHVPNPADKARLTAEMRAMGRKAREAAGLLGLMPAEQKAQALRAAAAAVRGAVPAILEANALDCAEAKAEGQSAAFLDRLLLNETRIEAIAASIEDIAGLPDPVGAIMEEWTRPNGLRISRVRTPLGVIGVIFESRPNVTADAGALCLKAGNAVILRTGSGALRSALAIHAAMQRGLVAGGVPEAAVQLVPFGDREAVGQMLAGLDGAIDVIVPRGGKSLVARVQQEARVPVFAHLDGNNHVYVHEKADLAMAQAVLLNAKLRRTGVCGAAETLLVDAALAGTHLKPLLVALLDAGCAVRGDAACRAADPRVTEAGDEDWSTEYIDAIIAAKVVSGPDEAIAHIGRYGSHHTDCIITADEAVAMRFLGEVDSAIVLHNASTQFADGGEFGFGAEIGIATGRMHARGPVGVEQLTSFKYVVRGQGTVRP